MSTFQVPQFIDQKPKIIGPLTLPQFFYLAGAAGIIFACFYIFNFFLWILISIVIVGIAVTLAFGKINGQEMPAVISAGIKYLTQPRVYTWQRIAEKKAIEIDEFEKIEGLRKKMSIQDKLKSIALNITAGRFFSPSQFRTEQKKKEGYRVATFITGEKREVKRVDY